MRIAGAYLYGFEPFKDQPVEFKPNPSPGLAEVHFFVGQNGTGKTRLLSLLAAACGNPKELLYRTNQFKSRVVVSTSEALDKTTHKVEKLRYCCDSLVILETDSPIASLFEQFNTEFRGSKLAPSHGVSHIPVSTTIAMAFRSIPSIEDQKLIPMGEVKWGDANSFLSFTHHAYESAQLCQALANLKVRMGIVSLDPTARVVRMVRAFDRAVQSITSSELTLTVGYVDKELRLKVSWLGKEMQIKQLPDGLRAIIGWLASVMCKLEMLLPDADSPLDAPITLLLDEPDAHLHPAWQRKLIPAVQKLLPNAQIFVATHSPFVISSVNAGWIYVFEADMDGKVTIKPPIPCGEGDSYIDVVEDVLGITERFDPETEGMLKEFRSKRDAIKRAIPPTPETMNEIQELAEKIAKRGETLQFMMGREMAQLRSQLKAAAV